MPYREGMSDIESIGRRAREARLASNLAQAEVARAAGISTKALGDFERTGKIRLENFLRILEVLGRGEEADALLRKRTLTPDEIDRINAVRTDASPPRRRASRPSQKRTDASRRNLGLGGKGAEERRQGKNSKLGTGSEGQNWTLFT